MLTTGPVCPSCGAAQPDPFCSRCGEKRIGAHDYSLARFFENALETFTHFDFKALKALRFLVSKPGFLTSEYMEGRRRGYVGPVQLFIITNVIFALLIGFTGWVPFNTPLGVQITQGPQMALKRSLADARMARHNLSPDEFARAFDAAANVQSKTWIFSMIPAFALLLAVLYGFRRYVVQHLVFAAHFYAFLLLAILSFALLFDYVLRPAVVRFRFRVDGELLSVIYIWSIAVVYLFFALRRAYGDRRLSAAARSVVLTIAVLPILQAYRFLLFFVTLWAMH